MTENEDRDRVDVSKEARAISRAIASMKAKAVEAGIANPYVFFESEGRVYVIDRDHPGDDCEGSQDRQKAIVGSAVVKEGFAVGAW